MSADRDVTSIVRTWLQDGVTSFPDHALDRVLDQVPAIRQERRAFAAWRNHSVNNVLKLALAAAAVVAVVVAGLNLVQRSDAGIGGPSATPSPSPSTTIEAEQFTLQASDQVRVTVDKPTTWRGDGEGSTDPSFAVVRGDSAPPDGMAVSFTAPKRTFEDPCQHDPMSPPVGPTVDDLVQALREVPNHTTTDPVSTTLGGLPATYIEMTADDTLPCAPDAFYIWDGIHLQGVGQISRIWVLDVDGSRIVAGALHYPEATEEMLAEEQLIVDSVQFE